MQDAKRDCSRADEAINAGRECSTEVGAAKVHSSGSGQLNASIQADVHSKSWLNRLSGVYTAAGKLSHLIHQFSRCAHTVDRFLCMV